MKVFIQPVSKSNDINPVIKAGVLNHFQAVSSVNEADVVLVPISSIEPFQLHDNIKNIRKPYVLIDFLEYGSSWDHVNRQETHLFGKNTNSYNCTKGKSGFLELDAFVRARPPLVYFKRELLDSEVSDNLKPVEFTCLLPLKPVVSKSEFDNRRIEVFYCWGLSSCTRPALHGEIFKQMCPKGYGVISHWDQFDGYFKDKRNRTWVSIYSPHYVRVPIQKIVDIQSQSKITVSMFGNGVKCFRSTECVGAILAMPYDNLAWGIPWNHMENCIRLSSGSEHESLCSALSSNDLYDIYRRSQETLQKYVGSNYVKNYMIPTIKERL